MAEKQANGSTKDLRAEDLARSGIDLPKGPKSVAVTECVMCKGEIKKGAKICNTCKSFQHPFRRFFAGIDIKSLVALVPVVTLAFFFLKDQIVIHRSDLRVTILDCEKDRIRVVSSNLGDRAGILHEQAKLFFIAEGEADPRPRLLMRDPKPEGTPIIKPGETVLIDFFPISTDKRIIPLDPCPPGKKCRYKVVFEVVSFDHQPYTIETFCNKAGG